MGQNAVNEPPSACRLDLFGRISIAGSGEVRVAIQDAWTWLIGHFETEQAPNRRLLDRRRVWLSFLPTGVISDRKCESLRDRRWFDEDTGLELNMRLGFLMRFLVGVLTLIVWETTMRKDRERV
jgi:hypothetical protein